MIVWADAMEELTWMTQIIEDSKFWLKLYQLYMQINSILSALIYPELISMFFAIEEPLLGELRTQDILILYPYSVQLFLPSTMDVPKTILIQAMMITKPLFLIP